MLSHTAVGQRAVVGNCGYTQESLREAFQNLKIRIIVYEFQGYENKI